MCLPSSTSLLSEEFLTKSPLLEICLDTEYKVTVKLPYIVYSRLLFSLTIPSLLLKRTEINIMLTQCVGESEQSLPLDQLLD